MKTARFVTWVALAAAVLQPAFGQYSYSTIVDSSTPRPDGAGNFFPCCYPAMENQYVVFTDNPGTAIEAIWSKNLITGALTKLVDLNTKVPGGTGNFVAFETCQLEGEMIRRRGGTVLFFGADASAPHCSGGLYAVSVTGGTIRKVVDYHQTMPDGGTYGELRGINSFDLSNGKVAFAVTTSVGGGVFSGTTSGAAPATIADTLTQYCYDPPGCLFPVTNYDLPAFSGSTVVYWGNGVFDPSTGYNDLLKTPIGGSTITEIANSNQALPGDTTTNFHTRFHFPFTDGNTVYFVADDTDYSGPCMTFTGVFSMSINGGAFTDVIDSCATLTGITQIDGQSSFESASANQGTVVYNITDATGPSVHAIYSSANGVRQRVIGGGDALMGGTVNGFTVGNPGPNATFGGRVAFETWTSLVYGLFLASPACGAIDTSLVSITLGSLSYNPTTKIYSQTATVTNTSSSNITGPLSLLATNLTAGTTMTNESGVTICEAPAGSPYINLNLGAKNVLPKTKTTTVTLQFKNPTTGNITFTPQLAGPGAR